MAQFEKADNKAASSTKQLATYEAQVAELQEAVQEETRQKLTIQSRLRQAEDEANALKDQLDDVDDGRKQQETKLAAITLQVCLHVIICTQN